MRHKILIATSAALCAAIAPAFSQITTFTGGGGSPSWSDSANWNPGVPTSTSDVEINADPDGGLLEVDTGGLTEIASLRVTGNVTSNFTITDASLDDALRVNGDLTNESSSTVSFVLPFTAGANATWSGDFQFEFAKTKILTNDITLNGGGIGFAGDATLEIDISTGVSAYGKFLGSFGLTMASGSVVKILITGAYTGVDGDVFDFLATGGFSGATLDLTGAALDPGLSWDQSLFATEGKLSVVPEPNTWALLALALVAWAFIPRRSRALAVIKKRF